jgi:hypothetical protein
LRREVASNGYVQVPGASAINLTGAQTISFWIKTSNSSGIAIGEGDWSQFPQPFWKLHHDTFYFKTTAGSNLQPSMPVSTDNNWHFYVAQFSPGNWAKTYKDGVLVSTYTTSDTTLSGSSVPLYLGKGGESSSNFTGYIDDVAIFSRILTAAEISGLYGGGSPTANTVSVTVSGYNGSISCLLNGGSITAPVTLSNEPAGSYTLACTPPSGYTLNSITPSATQTLTSGGTVGFTVSLTSTITAGTVTVLTTMNGQSYTGAVVCGFSNSPSNLAVNYVPFSQSSMPVGTYNLNCAAGPPNSQLQSFSPSSSLTLAAGGSITFTVVYTSAAVTVYSNPLPQPSGSWTWNLSAWQSSGSSWVIQPVLTFAGINYTYSHPEQYVLALQQIQSWGATGPLAQYISQFQAVLPYWPPYVVVPSPTSAPTVGGIYTPTQPLNNVFFSGNVSGAGFVSGSTTVYFCIYNTTTSYLQPAAGVAVNSSISLSVYNVLLTGGPWQVKVVTPYGTGIGPVFYVQ